MYVCYMFSIKDYKRYLKIYVHWHHYLAEGQ